MERTLYNRNGDPIAYITEDYHQTIYLWDGAAVAYLYNDQHVYGMNGRHLGWFIDEVLFNNKGERIGFTANSCPISIAKETTKTEKQARHEIQPRWAAPPTPKLGFALANQGLSDLLKEGQIIRLRKEKSSEEPA